MSVDIVVSVVDTSKNELNICAFAIGLLMFFCVSRSTRFVMFLVITGDALYSLRSSLKASADQLTDWNQNQVNPCTWSRVYCDPNYNVEQVSLAFMGFTGTLTPRIGVLKYLKTLSLQGNGITGGIPKELGNLTNLHRLDLENNRLTGEIPSSLGNLKKLQFLTLSQNNLTGTIPESLASLPSLINVLLDSNDLSGQIPDQLFEVSKYNSEMVFFSNMKVVRDDKVYLVKNYSFTGNKLNCGGNQRHPCAFDSADQGSSHKPKTGLIIGVIVGLVVILFLCCLLFFWCKGSHKGYKPEVYVDVAAFENIDLETAPVHLVSILVIAHLIMYSQCTGIALFLADQILKSTMMINRFWLITAVFILLISLVPLPSCSFVCQCSLVALHLLFRFPTLCGPLDQTRWNLGNAFNCEVDRRIAFGQLKRFAWRELQIATDNFSEKNVLGQGGFGKVYKGVLADNTKVAVKRLTDYESPGGDAAFQREVEMISVAVHRNLLRLIGFCTTPTERLLVYPFMQNLSVAYRLREIKPGEPVLDWPTRKRVALGTARGLEYLHEHCNPKIIHRDVKAANVLLDEDFEAVVGDFGLAKLVDVRKTNVTTQVRGTMGHIAPEYLSTGKSSERTDVFGYGIMLLEIVTGQRAIDFSRLEEEDDVLLLDHVKKLEREKKLDAIVDGNLIKNYNMQEAEMMIQVALLCTQGTPEDRPLMSEVVRMLEGEGLAERWEEWQHVEVNRRQEYERLQRRFDWGEDSVYNQDAIELSGGR
ncbi:hypothetical protein Lal_00050167 [Lupinus albus]|nr:hypothetical protein Lal_00050167 [Lupinus albus]